MLALVFTVSFQTLFNVRSRVIQLYEAGAPRCDLTNALRFIMVCLKIQSNV